MWQWCQTCFGHRNQKNGESMLAAEHDTLAVAIASSWISHLVTGWGFVQQDVLELIMQGIVLEIDLQWRIEDYQLVKTMLFSNKRSVRIDH